MRFPSLVLLSTLAAAMPAVAGTLKVPSAHYPTIQSAVSAAQPGDTVLISAKPGAGVYNEAVTVTTPNITLQGKNNPVLDGTGLNASGIEIQAAHVTVRSLTVQNYTGTLPNFFLASGINVGDFDPVTDSYSSYGSITVSGCTLLNDAQGVTLAGYVGPNPNLGSPVGTYLKNYALVNNVITGSVYYGASVGGQNVLVSGNKITGSGTDGLDMIGSSMTVVGNEVTGTLFGYGLSIQSLSTPQVTTVVALNDIHDNGSYGAFLIGALDTVGNLFDRNVGYGVELTAADYGTFAGNTVTNTLADTTSNDSGTGVYVSSTGYTSDGNFPPFNTPGGPLALEGNQISGNSGDGLFLDSADDVQVLYNTVTGNGEIGIHLSDFVYNQYAGDVLPGSTVSYNTAQQNTLFDARDDTSAHDDLNYPDFSFFPGDGVPTTNVWVNNHFGTTDPVGLSH